MSQTKIQIEFCPTQWVAYSFNYRIGCEWYKLSLDIKLLRSLYVLKETLVSLKSETLDNYLVYLN